MDVQEAYREHYKMWDWLSKNPKEKGISYFKKCEVKERPQTTCYLKEVHRVKSDKQPFVEKTIYNCGKDCPLYQIGQWCFLGNSWFLCWVIAKGKRRQKYAEKIRDVVLPYLEEEVKDES